MSPEELDRLLERGITTHLQPVVDLTRGNVAGYEALARFPGGPGPFEVFAAARLSGRGADLEAAALRTALAARREMPPNTFLTVNIGPDLIDESPVREVWQGHPSLSGIVVELTEQVRIESYAALEPVLDDLRSRGAMIAVDDAGAGYAGLQHLLALRPHFIKLDRDLVSGLDLDEAKRALVEVMGAFAGRIDAWVIAEGVETAAELDVLIDLRVPLAQGYHLGRPAPGLQSLEPEVALGIASRASQESGPTLRALLEQVPTVGPSAVPSLRNRLRAGEVAVVVDEHGRPDATLDADGRQYAVREAALGINLDTPTAMAAQRAIVRHPAVRFQPLVCTDNAGRYVGIVRIERILEALARRA
ncbi:EAL domain-containing protein [Nocardioides sp. BP30]|uniref:EAL domain-containing protein n=1 Tax=Nocardioides sp. BP30 TaxID=3036374 RepID=UPI0024696ADD|nr:EAL domain-containing protein [Nocardioides sp. BP30]WGL51636.1 EAL domain-containing protein [Nocardioides sp. BP30]